jgi:Rrf2 family nitric oxide-sensitive transcriptional repressor
MKLTRYSDYALRISLYLAIHSDRLLTITEITTAYGLPHGNVMKLASDLVGAGILESVRGRGGGVRLARPAAEISVGEIVRHTEGPAPMVDCSSCILAPECGLICVLGEAKKAFFSVLDGYSLEDVVNKNPLMVRKLLNDEAVKTGT